MERRLQAGGFPTKPAGNAGQGGPDRRGIDDGSKRPASVKASLSVAMGQRAPNRAGAREEGRGLGSSLQPGASPKPDRADDRRKRDDDDRRRRDEDDRRRRDDDDRRRARDDSRDRRRYDDRRRGDDRRGGDSRDRRRDDSRDRRPSSRLVCMRVCIVTSHDSAGGAGALGTGAIGQGIATTIVGAAAAAVSVPMGVTRATCLGAGASPRLCRRQT